MRLLLPLALFVMSVVWYAAPRGDGPMEHMSPALRAYFESPIEIPMPDAR